MSLQGAQREQDDTKLLRPARSRESSTTMAFALIENPRKSMNWGPFLRCCAAFDISIVVAVGFDKCSVDGSHGAAKHVQLVSFPTHQQAKEFLREKLGCQQFIGILGGYASAYDSSEGYPVLEYPDLELVHVVTPAARAQVFATKKAEMPWKETSQYPRSLPVSLSSTKKSIVFGQSNANVCFVVGQSPKGLSVALAKVCDRFVHVPHQPCGWNDKTFVDVVALNREACFSIVLHHWKLHQASGGGHTFVGQKYQVVKTVNKGAATSQEVRNEKKRARDALKQEADEVEEYPRLETLDADGDY